MFENLAKWVILEGMWGGFWSVVGRRGPLIGELPLPDVDYSKMSLLRYIRPALFLSVLSLLSLSDTSTTG